ncbi:hypothetical protein SCLCIDRAFT_861458 [Scleroderma citrinum Foug A]|uniref:Uncharacterized protein n=1 Tax=Scleroderma citrinum Foug A TaxID=1036808 RepID=A0A0C3D1X0_9AGAM|nr:hypothetical protein SCLCIDRAFT_861458 [Scleroderma citrinum Foug A]
MPNTSTSRLKAIFWFRVSRASSDVFSGAYTSFLSLLMCFHHPGCFSVSLPSLRAVFGLPSMLCTPVHTLYRSAWFPGPSASPVCHISALAVVFASFRTLCACVLMPDTPARDVSERHWLLCARSCASTRYY